MSSVIESTLDTKFFESDENSFPQFLDYLRKISKMSDLEYWFDKRKINNETTIKNIFKSKMLTTTTPESLTTIGQSVFDKIWGNVALRESLFPRANYPSMNDVQYKDAANVDFITFVGNTKDNMNSSFYDFIKVK